MTTSSLVKRSTVYTCGEQKGPGVHAAISTLVTRVPHDDKTKGSKKREETQRIQKHTDEHTCTTKTDVGVKRGSRNSIRRLYCSVVVVSIREGKQGWCEGISEAGRGEERGEEAWADSTAVCGREVGYLWVEDVRSKVERCGDILLLHLPPNVENAANNLAAREQQGFKG